MGCVGNGDWEEVWTLEEEARVCCCAIGFEAV